jgi:hypothetical protein
VSAKRYRLLRIHVCPECQREYHPSNKRQITCGEACGDKRRHKISKHNRFSRVAIERAKQAIKKKSALRAQRMVANCQTKAEAWKAGLLFGYEMGANRAYRRGVADGFSMGIGEKPLNRLGQQMERATRKAKAA